MAPATRVHLYCNMVLWSFVWTALCMILMANAAAAVAPFSKGLPLAESSDLQISTKPAAPNALRALLQNQQDGADGSASQQSNSGDSSSNGASATAATSTSSGVPVPITGGLVGSTFIVYTQPSGGTFGVSSASPNPNNLPIRVLICPGTPGCPDNNNSTLPASPGGAPPGTSSPAQSSGTSGVSGNKPVEPVPPRPEEIPPQDLGFQSLDLSRLKRPDTVVVTMLLKDTTPEEFVEKYGSKLDNITANISGTPPFVWNITVFKQLQQQQSNRRLLQQQQGLQFINVTLSLLTSSPLIVWHRLTLDSDAINQPFNPSSISANCNTDYCQQLTAAGIPVASDISVGPDYPTLLIKPDVSPSPATNGTAKPAAAAVATATAQEAAADMLLQNVTNSRQSVDFILRIVAGVATAVVGLLLLSLLIWKRDSIMRCLGFRAKKAKSSKAKPAKHASRKRKPASPDQLPSTGSPAEASAAMVLSDAAGADDQDHHDQDRHRDQIEPAAAEIKKPPSKSTTGRRNSQQDRQRSSEEIRGKSELTAIASMVSNSQPASPRGKSKSNQSTSESDPASTTLDLNPASSTSRRATGSQKHHSVQPATAATVDIPIPNLPPWPITRSSSRYSSADKDKYKAAAAAAAMSAVTGSQPSTPRSVTESEASIADYDTAARGGKKDVQPQSSARAAAKSDLAVNESWDEFVSESGTVITIQSSINAGVSAATSAALAAAVLKNARHT